MVDEEIVVDKLQYINEYTNDLKQMRGMSKAEYGKLPLPARSTHTGLAPGGRGFHVDSRRSVRG